MYKKIIQRPEKHESKECFSVGESLAVRRCDICIQWYREKECLKIVQKISYFIFEYKQNLSIFQTFASENKIRCHSH